LYLGKVVGVCVCSMEKIDWSKVNVSSYMIQTMAMSTMTRTLAYPFELIKTRIQHQDSNNHQYRGIVDCARQIKAREGVPGFYKGAFQICLRVPASVVYLATLETCVAYSPDTISHSTRGFVSGTAAGLAVQFYFVPIDVITQKMQVDRDSSGRWRHQLNNMNFIRHRIWQSRGWRGFYKGFAISCANHVPQATLFWTFYGTLKNEWHYSVTYATIISSITVNLLTMPFDTIKVRYQLRDDAASYYGMTRQLFIREGVKGLYKGFHTRLISALITNVTMTCWSEYWRSH